MAIALGNHTKVAGASGGTTPNIDTTGATLLVIAMAFLTGTGAVSDSQGNTWTPLTVYKPVTNDRGIQFFYVVNPSTSATHNFSTANQFAGLAVAAFTGTLTVSAFDNENGGITAPASTTVSTGSITPSNDNELIISAVQYDISTAPTDDASLTNIETVAFSSGVNYANKFSYKVQGSAAAINVTWTFASTSYNAANIASFKPATTTSTVKQLAALGVG